ncbi:unnamed protein product [Mytilus edulis]|uniref:Uncharacterized protein n=1 Tax=Mytilus edulis TaxID=6550 RepID=A0A8S3SQE0_MYTED|nr:unnamed protein product [Mytilus edulis]
MTEGSTSTTAKVGISTDLLHESDARSSKYTTFSVKDVILRETENVSFTTTSAKSTTTDSHYSEFGITEMLDAKSNKKEIITSEKTEELIYYIIASVAILLFVISIILCRVWMRGKYRIVIIKTPSGDIPNYPRDTAEDLTTHYETINENEMISDPVLSNDDHPFQQNNVQINTTDTYLICKSSSSTCSSDYEDIDNMYFNLYQSLENTRQDADLHTYCTATAAYGDLCKVNLYLWNKAERNKESGIKCYSCTSLRRKSKSDEINKSFNIERFNSLPNVFNV